MKAASLYFLMIAHVARKAILKRWGAKRVLAEMHVTVAVCHNMYEYSGHYVQLVSFSFCSWKDVDD